MKRMSKKFNNRQSQQGLSLIELMVAVAISSIVMFAAVTVTEIASKGYKTSSSRAGMTALAAAVNDRIRFVDICPVALNLPMANNNFLQNISNTRDIELNIPGINSNDNMLGTTVGTNTKIIPLRIIVNNVSLRRPRLLTQDLVKNTSSALVDMYISAKELGSDHEIREHFVATLLLDSVGATLTYFAAFSQWRNRQCMYGNELRMGCGG